MASIYPSTMFGSLHDHILQSIWSSLPNLLPSCVFLQRYISCLWATLHECTLVFRLIPYAAFRCSFGGIVILGYRGSDGDDRFPGEVLSRRAVQETAGAGERVLQVQRPADAGVHFITLHRRLGVHLLRLLGDQKAWTQDEHAGRRPRLSGRRRPKLRRCECNHAHLRAIVHGMGCRIRKSGITLPNFSFLFISIWVTRYVGVLAN